MINADSYDHFSFDLDGTLIDTSESMRIAWERTRKKFNLSPAFDAYMKFTGIPFSNIMSSLGINDQYGDIQSFYFEQTFKLSDSIICFDGVYEGIEFLSKSRDKTWSIITSKPRTNTEKILDRLGINPNVLVCGDDDLLGKPHTKPMLIVKESLNINKSHKTLYVGDTITDFIFSLNCGVDYVHADYGLHGALSDYLYPKCQTISTFKDIFSNII